MPGFATPCREASTLAVRLGGRHIASVDYANRFSMSVLTDTATIVSDLPRDRSRDRTVVFAWLMTVLAVLLALVLVGGATRLTDSGLSITEWKPIHGTIPPLNAAQWEEEFAKYREIPEYQLVNAGMSLAEFKVIYWWEWGHRFLARGVGLLFALPLAWFWITGRLERVLKPRLLALLVLGGSQGAVGWWMVASGLTERTDVSQYRLAVHLTLASFIIAAIVWVARGLKLASRGNGVSTTAAGVFAGLVLVQIYLGALVAGMDAGWAYNTWPLMDGAIVPSGLLAAEPWWINAFENAKTVQFIHRSFAYVVFAFAGWLAWSAWRSARGTASAKRAVGLFTLTAWQAVAGITTLVMSVPVGWALLHQGTAIVLLGAAVSHWRALVGPYRIEDSAAAR